VIAALLLVGCLPRQALSRADDLEATRYRVAVALHAEAGEFPEVRWAVEGELTWQWTRTFRDGTLGHLVAFDGVRSADGTSVWEGAALEIRSFPDGEIVVVDGLGPWSGTAGHLELVDALWPALSPRRPSDPSAEVRAAWPVLFPQGPGVRYEALGRWAAAGEDTRWEATVTGTGPALSSAGSLRGELESDRAGVRRAELERSNRLVSRWAGGREVTQEVHGTVTVERLGPTPRLPLLDRYARDDAASDLQGVRLTDGRTVDRARVRPDQLPFLLLDEASVGTARGTLIGTGSPP